MKLADRVYLVGSGSMGFGLSHPLDCNVFLLDGGDELALIDAGAGLGPQVIVEHVTNHGFKLDRVRHIILTHAHADHAGGAAQLAHLLPAATFYSTRLVSDYLREGDETGASVDVAKLAGIYPATYSLQPCEVAHTLSEGDNVTVGDVNLRVLDTPGHSDGHLSLLVDHANTRYLFSGDLIFHGGHILLQNIHDCNLSSYVASLRKVRQLHIDALFPSHLAFDLTNGQRHIERANAALDLLLLPNQIQNAW